MLFCQDKNTETEGKWKGHMRMEDPGGGSWCIRMEDPATPV